MSVADIASSIQSKWVACLWIENIGVAVEQARLPHLEGEVFALASTDGIIQATSDSATAWGVKSGMPAQSARSLCEDLIVLPYDRTAYEIAARTVWDALAIESNVVQPVSPELCYAEIQCNLPDLSNRLRHVTEQIAPRIGVPVRVGVARTKFVARRAAQEKSDGPLVISFGEEAQFLAHLPLASLPAHPKLDHKAKQQMQRLGVKTLGDIWALPPHRLPKSLQRIGHQLLQWAQGFDADPVKPLWPPRTISAEVRFDGEGGEGTADFFVIENALLKLAERIACQLSTGHEREFTREVALKVGLLDGTYLAETEKLGLPESQTPPLFRAAMRLFQRFRVDQAVTSLEIIAGEIGAGSGLQLSLMNKAGELPHERMKRLEIALIHLRKRYGPRAVISATLMMKARRIHLWIHPLGHLLCEPLAQVATDVGGTPVRYWRSGKRRTAGNISRREDNRLRQDGLRQYDVLTIHNRWRETGIKNGTLVDSEVWRVETDPFGVSDLRRVETEWRLTAGWD